MSTAITLIFFLLFFTSLHGIKGVASKMRYFRDSSQDHLRMLFQEEFFVYLSFYVVPFLRSIVFRGQSKSYLFSFFFFVSPF